MNGNRNRKTTAAFTLVEILIVVIILGILAAIVIPKFSSASDEARESALKRDLQTVRAQLELYRMQHDNVYPAAATFVTQLTTKTDRTGAAGTEFGPYMQEFPTNNFNDKTTVEVKAGTDGLGDGSHGWFFDTTAGRFYADTSDQMTW